MIRGKYGRDSGFDRRIKKRFFLYFLATKVANLPQRSVKGWFGQIIPIIESQQNNNY